MTCVISDLFAFSALCFLVSWRCCLARSLCSLLSSSTSLLRAFSRDNSCLVSSFCLHVLTPHPRETVLLDDLHKQVASKHSSHHQLRQLSHYLCARAFQTLPDRQRPRNFFSSILENRAANEHGAYQI